MAKRALKKLAKKYTYIQDSGSYSNEIIVTVGTETDEILAWMKKNDIARFIQESFAEEHLDNKWLHDGSLGKVWHNNGRAILWLKDWGLTWHEVDVLIHECMHLVQFLIVDGKGMQGENEAQAYQLEYYIKSIRERLNSKFYGKRTG